MNFAEVISSVKDFVKLAGLTLDQIAVTGGSGLLMYGLRENCGDIDMAVSREAMDKILKLEGALQIPNPGKEGVRWCKYQCFDIMDNMEPGLYPTRLGVHVVGIVDLYVLKMELVEKLGRKKDHDDVATIWNFFGKTHSGRERLRTALANAKATQI